jgi:hypothetical protein
MDGTRRLPTHNNGQYQRCGGAIGDLTGKEKKRAMGSELRRGWHLNVQRKTRNLPRGSTGGGAILVGHVIEASSSSSPVTVKPPLWCSSDYFFCFHSSDVMPS